MKGFENPIECENRAGEAIKDAIDIGIYKGHLCFFKGLMALRPEQHTNEKHIVFMNITSDMTREGLSPAEWDELRKRMWNFFKDLR